MLPNQDAEKWNLDVNNVIFTYVLMMIVLLNIIQLLQQSFNKIWGVYICLIHGNNVNKNMTVQMDFYNNGIMYGLKNSNIK